MLTVAKNLKLPESVFDQHLIVLGKTGSGKSSALRLFVESLLDREERICVIDPKGDWHGLRVSGDGKRAGYPVVIFGGKRADVPLNEHAGRAVGELVAGGNCPCVIDLGGWMVGERTRFFVDFAAALFRNLDAPLRLVIDECHNFAPQGKVLDPAAGKMLHWANRLASEGRGKGLTILSASQRPQKVHKDFLTCAETLVAMRVIHKLDRDAIKDWVDGAGDPKKGREVMDSLASMARGEGWVWSPEAQFGPARIQFPLFKTYDSFAAPAPGGRAQLKGWAEVDLDVVKAKLAATIEEAKTTDPAALQKRIRELEKQLAGKPAAAPAKVVEVEVPVSVISAESLRKLQEAAATIGSIACEAEKNLKRRPSLSLARTVAFPHGKKSPAPVQSFPNGKTAAMLDAARNGNGGEQLPGPQQRVLNAIAEANAIGVTQPTSELVAFLARYSPSSSSFTNTKGALRSAGLVEYPAGNLVQLTELGRAQSCAPREPATHAELHDRVKSMLAGPERRLLEPLLGAYPEPMASEELAQAAGYSATSSSFTNTKGRLRTLGLIDYPASGHVVATPILFP